MEGALHILVVTGLGRFRRWEKGMIWKSFLIGCDDVLDISPTDAKILHDSTSST